LRKANTGATIAEAPSETIKTVLFVEQVSKPPLKKHKVYFMQQLIEYALKYPDRNILIKVRSSNKIKHVNSQKDKDNFYKIWRLLISCPPKNIIFTEEAIEHLLPKVDLCLSFTSTVILEALFAGKKAVAINDFGIGKKNDNQVFVGSGIFCSMAEVMSDNIPQVNKHWYNENCIFSDDLATSIVEKSLLLLNESKRKTVKKPDVFYNQKNFSYFYMEKFSWLYIKRPIAFLLKSFMR
jgi:hypothetical protein